MVGRAGIGGLTGQVTARLHPGVERAVPAVRRSERAARVPNLGGMKTLDHAPSAPAPPAVGAGLPARFVRVNVGS